MADRTYTIKEFIDNPFGKGSAALSTKTNKTEYLNRYNQLAKKGKICRLHQISEFEGRWLLHVMVPSENVDKDVYYDVVVEFYPKHSSLENSHYLTGYAVRFYSNCPSFTYTFLNVYYKWGLLIPEFKNKVKEEFLEKTPDTRNPFGVINYDKSIFFACHYIMTSNNQRLLQKDYLHKALHGGKTMKEFVADVNNADEKMVQIKEADRKLKELMGLDKQRDENLVTQMVGQMTNEKRKAEGSKHAKIVTAKTKIHAKKGTVKRAKVIKGKPKKGGKL